MEPLLLPIPETCEVLGVGRSKVYELINAGLLEEILLDLTPVLLGGGVRLFDNLGIAATDLELLKVVQGKDVTHLKYRIVK